jgi:hypothetical protein
MLLLHLAREDQVLGAGTAGQLAGDRLADLVAHGHHAHAGQALGLGLEAAAEPAGLIGDLDDLDPGQLGEDAAAAQAQQLAAAQPGPDLDEEVVAVERPTGGQEMPDLLGGEGPSALVAKDLVGVQARLGASTSRTGLVASRRSLRAASRMRSRIERQAITPLC